MSTAETRLAYAVVLDMMPKPGIAGVELDSTAYRDILREHTGRRKSGGRGSPRQVDKQVRHLLGVIGKYGFGAFEEGA